MKGDLTLVMGLSLLPSDDFDGQLTRLPRTGSTSMSKEAPLSTPSNGGDEDDGDPALILSRLPADVFDKQVDGLSQQREYHRAVEDILGSLLMAMSLMQVRTTPPSYLSNSLKIVLERHARRFRCPVGR
jgi:hypothetical protein